MPMLGDLLAGARNAAGAFQGWLNLSDPELAAVVNQQASIQGVTVTSFVRGAIADFSRLAEEEDWATLISSLRDTDDPGTTCLLGMVHWRLTARSCAKHSHHHHLKAEAEA